MEEKEQKHCKHYRIKIILRKSSKFLYSAISCYSAKKSALEYPVANGTGSIFRNFQEKRTTSRGIPNFSIFSLRECPFQLIFVSDIRLNASNFGNSIIFGLSRNFQENCNTICFEIHGIFGRMESAQCDTT